MYMHAYVEMYCVYMYAHTDTLAYMEDRNLTVHDLSRIHGRSVRLFHPLAEKKLEIYVAD